MTILIIGGTGNTGLPLAKLLHDAGISALLTSRSGVVPAPYKGVSLDWFNPATYNNPFNPEISPDGTPIDRIYIVGPMVLDPLPFVKPFIELAISKGVKRFVLISGSVTPKGAPFSGKVHQYLDETPGIDFIVLRATWFMENFEKHYLMMIKTENYITSGAGEGKVPFVSSVDIAQAAFDALLSDEPARRDIFVVGPELHTYDEVASLLSAAVGREITHKRLTPEEYKQLFSSFGMPDEYTVVFAAREKSASENCEVETFNAPDDKKYVGKLTELTYRTTMTILIVGGTGNTGLRLAKLLHDAGVSILLTSRSGVVPAPYKGVSLDWYNPTTYYNVFNPDATPDGTPIDRIYMVVPMVLDPMPFAKPFVDLAISKGVKKIVLLSGSGVSQGAPFTGKIHQYLDEKPGIDFVVLRPTWFIDNFGTLYLTTIKSRNHIFSGSEDGKIPFVSSKDIAQAAFDALTSNEPARRECFVVGPELLTYDEVASQLSATIGREITHKRLSPEEYKQVFTSFGMPDDYIVVFLEREKGASENSQVDVFNAPEEKKYVGKRTLKDYLQENAAIWQ
ncbi:hypothetical protein CVT24_000612 [Panaeolus cyanescens]|uniref:NAD(P)-binding domain-containing protein n=1 Tax=Panaeolus cyanescens TaxID=181874 RepID=A0A409YT85_9AGAR|nr:hypothetical protein CVT24_000612 [Panaeolus cyanescens]